MPFHFEAQKIAGQVAMHLNSKTIHVQFDTYNTEIHQKFHYCLHYHKWVGPTWVNIKLNSIVFLITTVPTHYQLPINFHMLVTK